jgi:hypothetical protein
MTLGKKLPKVSMQSLGFNLVEFVVRGGFPLRKEGQRDSANSWTLVGQPRHCQSKKNAPAEAQPADTHN